MKQLLNDKNYFLTKLNCILIIIFPITLLAGSLLSNLTIVLISFFFLIDVFKKKQEDLFKNNNFYFLIIINLYLILNAIFIANNFDSIIRAVGFIRFIIFTYALSFYFFYFKKIIIKYWVIIFLIVSFDILFEYFLGQNILGFQTSYPGRIASFTGDELKIGNFYFALIFICLSFFKEKSQKIFFLVFLVFFIISLLIGERSNFLKVFIMYTIFVLFFYETGKLKKLIFFVSIIIASIVIVINNPHLSSKFTKQIYGDLNKDFFIKDLINIDDDQNQLLKIVKNNKHFAHYNIAINIFKENIFFGSGLKTFRIESYKKDFNIKGGGSTHPHQFHFEILSELGIIGYILIVSNILLILIKQKNFSEDFLKIAGFLYLVATLIPILPSGSFFTSYGASFFWLNYSFLLKLNLKKYNNLN